MRHRHRGMKRALISSFGLALGLSLLACSGSNRNRGPFALTVAPSQVEISAFVAGQPGFEAALTVTDGNLAGADVTASATFTSSDPGIASVDPSGVVRGVNNGEATIRVSFNGVVSDPIPVRVAVTPVSLTASANPAVLTAIAQQSQLVTLGNFDGVANALDLSSAASGTTYSSADAGIVRVDDDGQLTAVGAGSTTLTATNGGVSAQLAITVDVVTSLSAAPASPTLATGATQQLTVTGNNISQSDLTAASAGTSYESSDLQVVTVAADGLVTAGSLSGSAQVTARNAGLTTQVSVTVIEPQLDVSPSAVTLASFVPGNPLFSQTLTVNEVALGLGDVTSQVTYQSSNPAIVTVDAAGLLSAVSNGSATIELSFGTTRASLPVEVRVITFTDSGQALRSVTTFGVRLADFDGDGDLDLLSLNTAQTAQPNPDASNRVFINDGAGVFTDSGQALGASDSETAAVGDVDGDGDLDFVTANFSSQSNRLYLNDGQGGFTDSGQSLGAGQTDNLALADFDDDGDLDVVFANVGVNRVLFNDGAGVFTDSGQALGDPTLSVSLEIAVGDFDGDGDLDFATANGSPTLFPPNTVFLNDGQGVFTDSGQSLGAGATTCVEAGDVDGDGDIDLVFGNFFTQANRVFLNDGQGVFTDSGQNLGASATFDLVLRDLDQDGDLDLVSSNLFAQPNQIYVNDGQGRFTNNGHGFGQSESQAMVSGDVDGDGDLDLVVGTAAQPNEVYLRD